MYNMEERLKLIINDLENDLNKTIFEINLRKEMQEDTHYLEIVKEYIESKLKIAKGEC